MPPHSRARRYLPHSSHEDLLVWALVLFIASFAFSQGAVIWVYLSEVFPTRVRAQGQSLGSFTHWAMNAAISFAFPVFAKHSRGLPVCGFRHYDGGPVYGGLYGLSGDKRRHARRHAEEARNRVAPLLGGLGFGLLWDLLRDIAMASFF